MNRPISPSLSRVSNIVVVAVLVFVTLSVFYKHISWQREPTEAYIRVEETLNVLMLIAYVIFGFAIWLTGLKTKLKFIIIFFIVGSLLCVGSVGVLNGSRRLLSSAELASYRYYLVSDHGIGDSWDFYQLYRCYIVGNYCKPVEAFGMEGNANQDSVKLVADRDNEKLYVFKNGYLEFVYDAAYQQYDSVGDITLGENRYRLESNTKPTGKEIILTRCDREDFLNCDVLYSSTVLLVDEPKLVYDERNRTLRVLIEQESLFSATLP